MWQSRGYPYKESQPAGFDHRQAYITDQDGTIFQVLSPDGTTDTPTSSRLSIEYSDSHPYRQRVTLVHKKHGRYTFRRSDGKWLWLFGWTDPNHPTTPLTKLKIILNTPWTIATATAVLGAWLSWYLTIKH
jgi:hypothetical protein